MRWYHYLKTLFPLIILAILLLIYRSHLSSFLRDFKDSLTSGADLVTIFGGIGGVITLTFIWIQLLLQDKQSKRLRTYELLGRYYHPEYVSYTFNLRKFLERTDKTSVEKLHIIDNFKEDEHEMVRKAVHIMSSYFEELGLMYKKDLVDRQVTKDLLRGVVIYFYDKSNFLIVREQEINPRLWINWTYLYLEMKKVKVK